MIYKTLHKN